MRQLNAFKQLSPRIKHKLIRTVIDSLEERQECFSIKKREVLIEIIFRTTTIKENTIQILEQSPISNNDMDLFYNSSRNLYFNQATK